MDAPLTPSVSSNLTATVLRTVANAPFSATTDQGYVTWTVTAPLTARTTVSAGARYQLFHQSFQQNFYEAAIFAGLNYTFK